MTVRGSDEGSTGGAEFGILELPRARGGGAVEERFLPKSEVVSVGVGVAVELVSRRFVEEVLVPERFNLRLLSVLPVEDPLLPSFSFLSLLCRRCFNPEGVSPVEAAGESVVETREVEDFCLLFSFTLLPSLSFLEEEEDFFRCFEGSINASILSSLPSMWKGIDDEEPEGETKEPEDDE
jgi:hypothetical protein